MLLYVRIRFVLTKALNYQLVPDDFTTPCSSLCVQIAAEVSHRIYHYNTIGTDMLHNIIHLFFRNCNAAACTGLSFTKAMKEKHGTLTGCAFFIIADIDALTIFVSVFC